MVAYEAVAGAVGVGGEVDAHPLQVINLQRKHHRTVVTGLVFLSINTKRIHQRPFTPRAHRAPKDHLSGNDPFTQSSSANHSLPATDTIEGVGSMEVVNIACYRLL